MGDKLIETTRFVCGQAKKIKMAHSTVGLGNQARQVQQAFVGPSKNCTVGQANGTMQIFF